MAWKIDNHNKKKILSESYSVKNQHKIVMKSQRIEYVIVLRFVLLQQKFSVLYKCSTTYHIYLSYMETWSNAL